MKTKEQINEKIYSLIKERGGIGREIDRYKAISERSVYEEKELESLRGKWNNISAIMNALEWVVDDVRYPYIPPKLGCNP